MYKEIEELEESGFGVELVKDNENIKDKNLESSL
jgi:hypothetical protein